MKPCKVQTLKSFICFNGQHFCTKEFLEQQIVEFYCSNCCYNCSRCFFMEKIISLVEKGKDKLWFRITVKNNNYLQAQVKVL